MDLKNISKLLPEFLEMFKGDNSGGLQEILSSLGNFGMLKNILGSTSKYTKYLPLLPILSNLNKEGFKGLLNDSENVSKIMSVLSNPENGEKGLLEGLDLTSILKFLPLISGFFGDKKTKQDTSVVPTINLSEKAIAVKIINPLSWISDIADKEIIYALNKYISHDLNI